MVEKPLKEECLKSVCFVMVLFALFRGWTILIFRPTISAIGKQTRFKNKQIVPFE